VFDKDLSLYASRDWWVQRVYKAAVNCLTAKPRSETLKESITQLCRKVETLPGRLIGGLRVWEIPLLEFTSHFQRRACCKTYNASLFLQFTTAKRWGGSTTPQLKMWGTTPHDSCAYGSAPL